MCHYDDDDDDDDYYYCYYYYALWHGALMLPYWLSFPVLPSDRVAFLVGSAGVDSGSGSAGSTSFPKAKGLWQATQKQKTVDDLVIAFRRSFFNIPAQNSILHTEWSLANL